MPAAKGEFAFFSTALGPDVFSVVSFTGHEKLSCLYEFDISLVSERADIDLDEVLVKPAQLIIRREEGDPVVFHGIIRKFEQQGKSGDYLLYRATLSPRFWWLTLTHHNQVCLNQSAPDFLEKTLLKGGLTFTDFEFRLKGSYPEIEYVCQYGESHFNFISRWLEREGIYYYFEQESAGEKLIITDAKSFHGALPEERDLIYSPPSGLDSSRREEVIHSLSCCQRFLPGKVILRDYNYERPSLEVLGEATVDPLGRGEVYLYGEHFPTPEEGNRLAAIRAEELFCRKQEFFGESTVPFLRPGFLFTMKEHFRDSFNREYLIEEVTHEVNQSGFLVSGLGKTLSDRDQAVFYRNTFKAIPSDVQYRPERKAEKPRMAGTLHARVDAEGSGNYAELDTQGRYKVRLPFDTDTAHGAGKASHFVRMAQPYSGPDYGVHFPLHKGSEVLLTFIDGDPDRPIIAGAVPNPETTSPVTAANQTKSIFRDNYGNEMVFDSTPGDEHIRLFSPHHTSLLQLGRSIVSESESDGFEWKGGNSVELGAGNKFAAYAGNSAEVKAGLSGSASFGLNYELQIAGKHGFFLGYEAGISIGPEFKCRFGPTIEKSDSDKSSIAAGDSIISAQKVLNLIGGAKTDPGSTTVATFEDKKIILSIGTNKNPDSTKKSKWVAGTLIGTPIAGTIIATILAGAMIACIEIKDEAARAAASTTVGILEGIDILANIVIMVLVGNLGLKDSINPVTHFDADTDKIKALVLMDEAKGVNIAVDIPKPKSEPQKAAALIDMNIDGSISINSRPAAADKNKIILGVGDLAAADDAQDASIRLKKSGSNIEIQSGKAFMWFKKNGTISIENKGATEGNKSIQLMAESDVQLSSASGDLVFKGKAVYATKGIFKTKNIHDLG